MKIVFDTSILIDNLRGGKVGDAIFDSIQEQNAEFFIPTIVIYELFSGKSAENPKVLDHIKNLIKRFKRVELTEEIAKRAGELYRETGKTFGPQDYIIAATTLEIGGTILTLNKKHFAQIPGLPLYPI